MDASQREYFRQLLGAERQRYLTQIENLNASGLGRSQSDACMEFATYDNHPADLGTETFEREKDLGLRWAAQRQVQAVDHALERLDAGTYGRCEICGQQIPPERLQVLPSATLCVACKSAQEQLPDEFPRPIEEKVLHPPFARSFRDHTTEIGYDGEDAWQDVAAYGTAEGPQDVPGARDYDDLYHSAEEVQGRVEDVDVLIDAEGEPLDTQQREPAEGERA